jgi:hypothetical protein
VRHLPPAFVRSGSTARITAAQPCCPLNPDERTRPGTISRMLQQTAFGSSYLDSRARGGSRTSMGSTAETASWTCFPAPRASRRKFSLADGRTTHHHHEARTLFSLAVRCYSTTARAEHGSSSRSSDRSLRPGEDGRERPFRFSLRLLGYLGTSRGPRACGSGFRGQGDPPRRQTPNRRAIAPRDAGRDGTLRRK